MHDPGSVSRPAHSKVDPECQSENGFPVVGVMNGAHTEKMGIFSVNERRGSVAPIRLGRSKVVEDTIMLEEKLRDSASPPSLKTE